ncbi:poly-beta-1,6-N-acetyl-D-glucosamine N-deacetylase PgaB [Corticimicrobacter populi]|uniref:Poly-beta-1,6-N-acetyl-D-glucosamine N-deacetylase PgaB n=1 Tax=Corticimicrobacter populi TaxID=2175229 RepID=A0A2V1K2T0_9BURK|nr:poly-beta-1,6-N-acetyl-D-glucosamine N-deacetylase PgaB [Corticimicrobacter populi]PWF22603.1 poly-beta-1,6-N-acetyl-D-glucosamine N-deacetylase PgaB [Corticimicrobacter populi]
MNARTIRAWRTGCATTLLLLMLAACAKDLPVFTPPAERPLAPTEQPWPANQFLSLAYHDVDDLDADQRFVGVRTDRLLTQLAWLRENGYQAVSVDQVLAARQGGPTLPDKAVLLSFDDGYSSFYTRVFPLLKAYRWPAIFALVGRWLDTPAGEPVDFGGLPVARTHFTTWAQIAEMSDSGLVEIASHTNNLHFGIQANPQGNQQPAATTLAFDARTGTYEDRSQYRDRLTQDARNISARIAAATGRAPRVWVWPYGASTGAAIEILGQQGYRMTLTLQDGPAQLGSLMSSPRFLVSNDPSTREFAHSVHAMEAQEIMRVMHVDLDYVYDPDPEQTNENLGVLVQRIKDMGVTHVFLQAFADPAGDGLVKSLYFPNRWLPMRADLFNRAAWQIFNRADVKVFAWMPVLGFDFGPTLPRVQAWDPATGATRIDPDQYIRLSPFDAEVRRRIGDIYEDLAWQAPFTGILFHDDALLGDVEDASPAARAAYLNAGLPDDLDALRADPDMQQRWSRFKSQALIGLTQELTERVRKIRGPHIQTARNLFALPILDPASETWFAQNLDDFLAAYDWVAPMAMPLMEKIPPAQTDAWLDRLVDEVAKRPGALARTVFELQAVDWRAPVDSRALDSAQLARWMERLQMRGALNFGYYPDDFATNQPHLDTIRPALSREWYPLP